MTSSTLALGVAWAPDTAARFQRLTGVEAQFQDWSVLAPAVFDLMNRRGGIAGRRLVLRPWYRDRGNGHYHEWQQQQCVHFTEQVKVFAVLSPAPPGDVLQACWSQHGMPALDVLFHFADDETYRRHPGAFSLASPSLTRFAPLYVDELVRQGFFRGTSGIGLVTYDTPRYRRVVRGALTRALRRHGLEVREVAWFPQPDSNAQLAEIVALRAPAAVRQFREAGVDRVLFLETTPLASGAFMTVAEEQQYRGFRYGLSSFQRPNVPGRYDGHALPTGQLARSQGLGWSPVSDLQRGAETPLGEEARWWLEQLRRRGAVPRGCRLCAVDALRLVDMVRFLEAGLAGAEGPVNLDRLRRGAEALGTRAPSLAAYRNAFRAGRHDGLAAYRELRWSDACRCLQHVGPLRGTG